MANLPKLDRFIKLVKEDRTASPTFHLFWQTFAKELDELLDGLEQAIEDIEAALAAAGIALDAAEDAQAAADAAQAAADDAQAAVDAINVPATGTRVATTSGDITNDDGTVLVDASGGPVTMTLASAGTFDHTIRIQKVDGSANAVTIDGNGAEQINGSPTLVLASQYSSANLASDGTSEWYSA
jgi:hypothetical protein